MSGTGDRVVYTGQVGTGLSLFSVPIDASAGPVQLNPTLAPGGSLVPWSAMPVIASGWVLYKADREVNDVFELFSVPVDGSAPAHKVNGPLVGNQIGSTFRASNGRVVFNAPVGSLATKLFVAPLDGSSSPSRSTLPGRPPPAPTGSRTPSCCTRTASASSTSPARTR